MNPGIVVVGAGGHAKVCIELLRDMGLPVAFCVGGVEDPDLCAGVLVLKGDEHLERLIKEGYSRAFIALGSNLLREKLAQQVESLGFQLVKAISPHAVVSPSAKLGSGVAIMAGAIINAEASIGRLAIVNTGATVDHDCTIGDVTHIAPQCALAGNVTVGSKTFLGVGTKVIPKIDIGESVILGAGSVVVRNIQSHTTAVGVPAKVIKTV
jgi:UDP-perosamine 4-acetyltransferase